MPKRQIGFALALVLLVAPAAVASAGTGQSGYEREQVMSAQFDTHAGGTLVVDVPDADVTLRTGSNDQVEIEVWLKARDMDRARDRFERMGFNANGNDDRVELTAERIRGSWWDWRGWGSFNISVEIALPRQYDVDLKTDDGDVSVQSQEGVIRLQTSDGDIGAETLVGDIYIRTTDGDIVVRSIEAVDGVEIRTSDGDISVGDLTASRVAIRTSDGDISSSRIAADQIETLTSDGDIALDSVAGALSAQTNDGDIHVRIEKLGASDLRTGDGNITIEAPESLRAELDLHGRIDLNTRVSFSGTLDRRNAKGDLNGGGPLLKARTGDGTIVLRLRDTD